MKRKKDEEIEKIEESRKTGKQNNQTDDAWTRPKTTKPIRKQHIMSVGKLCLLLALSIFLVLTMSFRAGSGASQPGLGEDASTNVSLQNEKIAVFGTSYAWEPFGPHLKKITGLESAESFIYGATTVGGALPYCGVFNQNKFGIIVVEFGGEDRLHNIAWEQTEVDLRRLFRNLKNTGAVVVYNQVFPDSTDYPYTELAIEEGVIPVPYITEGIVRIESGKFVFNPVFDGGDGTHPNDEGYSVMAERTAQALLDAGIVKNAETCKNPSANVTDLFSNATNLLEKAEQEGFDTEDVREAYSKAEYLWQNQFCYTTSWELKENIIAPITTALENMEEINQMFSEAEALIEEAKRKGTDTEEMETNHQYAETSWTRMDPSTAKHYLQKILDEEPEITALHQSSTIGETLFEDDFDQKDTENWMWRFGAEGTINLRDGYAFLNLTKGPKKSEAGLVGYDKKWHYCGLEITLRCSDDNKLESSIGGGLRAWGFIDEIYAENWLGFFSYCPESDPDLVGFSATAMAGGDVVLREPVTGIDMREWHTYTIIWDKNNATFLVDRETIATTNKTPSSSQRLIILANSGRWSKDGPYGMLIGGLGYVNWIDLKYDEQIQVDKVRVFSVPETTIITILCIVLLSLHTYRTLRYGEPNPGGYLGQ